MLVGYEANNPMRNSYALGQYCRDLLSLIALRYSRDYRALLFSTHIKPEFSKHFVSYSNVSTYLPTGSAKMVPSLWLRYRLNPVLMEEKVKIFHGLNEELPYHIGRDIKTIITCYGHNEHHTTSLMDSLFWHQRTKYALSASNVVVAISDQVRDELLAAGVNESKVVVIGDADPMRVTDSVADRYMEVYRSLIGE